MSIKRDIRLQAEAHRVGFRDGLLAAQSCIKKSIVGEAQKDLAGFIGRFEELPQLAREVLEHGPDFTREVVEALKTDSAKALLADAVKRYEAGECEECENPWSPDGKNPPESNAVPDNTVP